MKYKLLCIDIDGTLVNDKKEIPSQVKESLKKVADKGIRIALISGRMPQGVDVIEKELGIACIKACNAGTYILMGDQCMKSEYMSNTAMNEIYIRIAKKYNIPLWIFREREWIVTEVDAYVKHEEIIVSSRAKQMNFQTLLEKWKNEGKSPNKLVMAAEPELIQQIYQEMKGQLWQDIDIACSADTFLEIFPKGIDKGTATTAICQGLNISLKETIAFGDQELDIPMLEIAGIGVAMDNAIAELKKKADYVTKSNNEAGVAYALEELLL